MSREIQSAPRGWVATKMGRIECFAESVDALLRERASDIAIVPRIARLLQPLVAENDWLPASMTEPVPGKPYSQYLLHLAPDSSWSFVSFVWPAGSSTPVHDHGCWGVVGVYQGEETETAFRLMKGEREVGPVTLEPRATRVMRPGDVATIVPPDDIHQVSNGGGRAPAWSRDGRELFFINGTSVMAVAVTTTPTFGAGNATTLFDAPGLVLDGRFRSSTTANTSRTYDVARDGRFLMIKPRGGASGATPPRGSMILVENWIEEVKTRVSATGR